MMGELERREGEEIYRILSWRIWDDDIDPQCERSKRALFVMLIETFIGKGGR